MSRKQTLSEDSRECHVSCCCPCSSPSHTEHFHLMMGYGSTPPSPWLTGSDNTQFMMGFSKWHGALKAVDKYSGSARAQHQALAITHKVGGNLQKRTWVCFTIQNKFAIDTSTTLILFDQTARAE